LISLYPSCVLRPFVTTPPSCFLLFSFPQFPLVNQWMWHRVPKLELAFRFWLPYFISFAFSFVFYIVEILVTLFPSVLQVDTIFNFSFIQILCLRLVCPFFFQREYRYSSKELFCLMASPFSSWISMEEVTINRIKQYNAD